jgi:dTDP-4-amino-4,6-dideoxygalactose transaminase
LKRWKRRAYLLAAGIAFYEPLYRLTWMAQKKTPLLDRLTKAYHLEEAVAFPPDHLDMMLNVEAAVGLEQLKRYPELVVRRREHAAFLDVALMGHPELDLPPLVDGATYSHYVARVRNRDAWMRKAARRGVELGQLIEYSIPRMTQYADAAHSFPNADHASRCTINLPIHPSMTDEQLDEVVRALR